MPKLTLIWEYSNSQTVDDSNACSGPRDQAGYNLLGGELSGADVMMGFTLFVAKLLGILDDRFPRLQAYMARLEARPAFQKAAAA